MGMQVGFLLCCLVGWVHGSEICVVEDGLRLFGGDDPWWISSGTGGGVSPRCTAVGNGEWRREAVKEAALHAWNGYVDSAWGMDELQPLSMQGVDNFGGMGATIVDSLSTLYVMGLEEEFEKAKEWVAEELDFDQVGVRTAKSFFAPIFRVCQIKNLNGVVDADNAFCSPFVSFYIGGDRL